MLWNDDDKNLMLRGKEIVEGTHVLKHNLTTADMATQAEDESADLVKAERCHAAGGMSRMSLAIVVGTNTTTSGSHHRKL